METIIGILLIIGLALFSIFSLWITDYDDEGGSND